MCRSARRSTISRSWSSINDAQLAPVGVRGEICVAGIGVGAGYWRQPQRTAAAFVDNPHADRTFGATLYRTGDIGRWRNDGRLEFLGRVDQQVKIRGFRVELGEVEAALTRRTDVRDAIVVDHLDQRNERQLVGLCPGPARQQSINRLWRPSSYSSGRICTMTAMATTTLSRADPTFNFIGWESTYTGEPLSAVEMEECVDNAVSRILAHRPPAPCRNRLRHRTAALSAGAALSQLSRD